MDRVGKCSDDTDQNAITTQSVAIEREAIQTVTLPLAESFMDESNIKAKK